jgi:hypothetical protein
MADPVDPNAPTTPGAPPPQTGFLGGLTNLLNNPLVQGAAAAYFGAAQGPRHESMAGRIGEGGLAGLQQYNTARQNQLLTPLLYGKLALQQAQTQAQQARAPLMQAQAKHLVGDPAANQQMSGQLQLMANSATDPSQKAMFQGLAAGVASGTIPGDKAFAAASKGDVDAASILLKQAQTTKAQADTSLDPLKATELTAQAGAANARASEASSTITRNLAEASAAGKAKPPPMVDATTGKLVSDPSAPNAIPLSEFEKLQTEMGAKNISAVRQKAEAMARTEYQKLHPTSLMGAFGPSATDVDAYARDAGDKAVTDFIAAGGGVTTKAPGAPAPMAPAVPSVGGGTAHAGLGGKYGE